MAEIESLAVPLGKRYLELTAQTASSNGSIDPEIMRETIDVGTRLLGFTNQQLKEAFEIEHDLFEMISNSVAYAQVFLATHSAR